MNPHSVMFEVGFCVMFYTTVLMFEFSAAVLERFNLATPLKWVKAALIPLVIMGILLSTLHQSSLGTLYLIMPNEAASVLVHAGAAVLLLHLGNCGGPGDDDLRIFVELAGLSDGSWSCRSSSNWAALSTSRCGFTRCCALKTTSIVDSSAIFCAQAMKPISCGWSCCLALVVPLTILSFRKGRLNGFWLYLASCSTLLGFVTNRLNVSITGFETWAGHHYYPEVDGSQHHGDDHRAGILHLRLGREIPAYLRG